ncbi:MAG: hypothetical protein PUD54_02385, partial [Veillonellaceae bacterium]|nr:hypothetical protein [Veillonellaceae bacterium]
MRIKSKKKLALLVSMALTVGTSMAVSPMEAYAFTSVGYSEFMNGPEGNQKPQGIYTVTKYDGSKATFVDADEAVEAALESLKQDTGNSAINFGLWKGIDNNVAADRIRAFQTALASKDMTINAGKGISFTQSVGDQVVLFAGEAENGIVNISADGTVKVNSNMASIGVVGSSAKIEVADGATLGAVALTNEDVNLKVSGTGNITAVGAEKNCTITGETKINNLGVKGNLTSTTSLNADNVNAVGDVEVTGDVKANNLTAAGDVKAGGALEAESITAQGNLEVGGDLTAKEVTANSVTLKGAVSSSDTKINADSVTLDATSGTAENIAKMKLAPKNGSGTVNVKVVTADGSVPSEDIQKAIEKAAGANKVTVIGTSAEAEKAQAEANGAIAKANEALEQVNEFAAKDAAEIAQANPFTTKLPSA